MAQFKPKAFSFDPANLKHRISLKHFTGNSEQPWQLSNSQEQIAEIWAGIAEIEASDQLDADQRSNRINVSFVIRYREDLESTDIIGWDGKDYDLLSHHDPDASRRWLIIKTQSRLGHG